MMQGNWLLTLLAVFCFDYFIFQRVSADNVRLPGKPRNFKQTHVSWTSFNITWSHPDKSTSGPVTYYHIKLYDPDGKNKSIYRRKSKYNAINLQPGTLYSLQIFAANNRLESKTPLLASVTTLSDTPHPDAPRILNEKDLYLWENIINLTWSTPEGNGLPITRYKIWKRELNFDRSQKPLAVLKSVAFGTNYVLINLSWDKMYHFAVTASNKFKTSLLNIHSIISVSVTKGPTGTSTKVPYLCLDILAYQDTVAPFGSARPYMNSADRVIRQKFNVTATPFHMCSDTAKWFMCAKFFPSRNQRTGLRIPPCRSFCTKSQAEVKSCVYGNARMLNECTYFPKLNPKTRTNCLTGPQNESSALPCPHKISGREDSYGVFEWPETKSGLYAKIHCPFGPDWVYASRKCFISGTWGSENFSSCRIQPSEINQALQNISEILITNDNVNTVSKRLLDLTQATESLESYDIGEVAGILEDIVVLNGSLSSVGSNIVNIVSNIMMVNESTISRAQQTSRASTRIVKSLETLTENVPLNGQEYFRIKTDNIELEALDVNTKQLGGLKFGATKKSLPGNTSPSQALASVSLPNSIFSTLFGGEIIKRIAFIVYHKSSLFKRKQVFGKEDSVKQVNSLVIAASIKGVEVTNLSSPVVSEFEHVHPVKFGAPMCAYWDFEASEGIGGWSSQGCSVAFHDNQKTICHCDHMTNFAMLMDVETDYKAHAQNREHEMALNLITYVGCGLSIFGLTLTLITLFAFRELRTKTPNRILISLCFALLLVLIVFLFGAERTEPVGVCRGVAVLLHYFILVAFSWMAVEALNMYLLFVKVMPTKTTHFFLKCSIIAWGLPAFMVAISFGIATEEYGGKYFCRVTGTPFVAVFLTPVMLVIIFNTVIFVMVQRSLMSSKSVLTADKKSSGRQSLRRSSAITVLLGLTWAFGVLAVKDAKLVFQYLFCLFNAFQGFLIFLFYCLLQPTLRRRWRHCLTGKEEPAKCDAKASRSSLYNQNLLDRSRTRSSSNGASTKSSAAPILATKV